jgi:hypothetical protein
MSGRATISGGFVSADQPFRPLATPIAARYNGVFDKNVPHARSILNGENASPIEEHGVAVVQCRA